MHDLRLVGVHEDGEHLLLSDAEGARFLLAVDEALRAAVRRDRPHLGQLQIEIEGGLRPRDVQSRIRAGATAEEVAALAGWSVEKVQRYEGPVLAEREHVAAMAREVRLRRHGGSVTLGAEVSRRLTARGVEPDEVRWDSWRVEGDPWTVVVTFPAGGRERSARWHFDLVGRSVSPGDDEARWLSEDQPEGEGPLAGARLSAVALSPTGTPGGRSHVYDVEVDGGIGSHATPAAASTRGEALDLMSAMRARRQAGSGPRRRSASHVATSTPPHGGVSDVPSTGVHPAGRRRVGPGAPKPEPLELDPSLMDDPPAAHPPAGSLPAGTEHEPAAPSVTPPPTPTPLSPLGIPLGAGDPEPATHEPKTPAAASPHHWPLAEAMRRSPQPTPADGSATWQFESSDKPASASTSTPGSEPSTTSSASEPSASESSLPSGPESSASEQSGDAGRHRGSEHEHRAAESATSVRDDRPEATIRPAARRTKRASVPSWDDIMFGAKQD
jgi:hypothetical protein